MEDCRRRFNDIAEAYEIKEKLKSLKFNAFLPVSWLPPSVTSNSTINIMLKQLNSKEF